jgi:MFS family permease
MSTIAATGARGGTGPGYAPAALGWLVWGLGATLYAIGFFQRTAPAVMTSELMADFGITAGALGNLASCYFYAYVLTLIPAGMVAATFGPRKLLTAGALATGIGLCLYALAPAFPVAGVGLAIVGAAGALAMVLTLELAGRWLPHRRFALASGLTVVSGVVGALLAGVPLRLVLTAVGWRPIMLASAVLSTALGVAVWRIVRDDPSQRGYLSYRSAEAPRRAPSWRESLAGLSRTVRLPNTWLLLAVPGGLGGAILSFSGLWGVPYLKARFGLPTEQAALVCSLLLGSFAIGSPAVGLISDRLGRRKPTYVACVVTAAVGWAAVILLPSLSFAAVVAVLAITGFATGVGPLSYAVGRESAPAELSATITGVVLTGIMVGPAILQPVTGLLLDLNWNGAIEAGVRVYDLSAYRIAFLPTLLWTSGAALIIPLLKETWCGEKKPGA